MDILIKVSQFVLSLSILVVLHELGHFTFAKIFGARVEKFYLFFNPWFELFKFKKGDTEYGIGWLPLGGYVKISGMMDESMDTEQLKQEPKSYEFRAKPAWQRLLIMIGGVLVNFILAFIIYSAVLFTWGEQYLPAKNVKYGIVCDSLSRSIGLQNGDKILKIDNEELERFSQIIPRILLDDVKTLQVERNGQMKDISIPTSFKAGLLEKSSKSFKHTSSIGVRIPFHPFSINSVKEKSLASEMGVLVGDKFIAVNGNKFEFYDQFKDYLKSMAQKEIVITVDRAGESVELKGTLGDDYVLGVFRDAFHIFDYKNKNYSLAEAIPAGVNKGFEKLFSYLKQFKLIFSSETKGYQSLGGFGSIASIFPNVWDWYAFWNLTAFLSIILAVMNILPIPALDGGHVLFLFYEIISGRKPSDKFLEYAQSIGMFLLFGLLIFANLNDVFKAFR